MRVICSPRMRVYMRRTSSTSSSRARSFVAANEFLRLGQRGHDPGPDHLPEQRFLGVEIEVERALAHPGQAGDVIQLGPGEPGLAEDGQGGVDDLVRTGLGAALPAGRGGGDGDQDQAQALSGLVYN